MILEHLDIGQEEINKCRLMIVIIKACNYITSRLVEDKLCWWFLALSVFSGVLKLWQIIAWVKNLINIV